MTKKIPQPKVFVSHSSRDKGFVRLLVGDLQNAGLDVWFDEAEIGIGDSIVGRINDAIRDTNYLIVVLSANSVDSPWVQAELNAAMMRQFSNKGMLVLPIKIDQCEVPALLKDRVYADFQASYKDAFAKLLKVFKLEFAEPQVSYSSTADEVKPKPSTLDCREHCKDILKNLIGHDLRREIQKCCQIKHLEITWHAVFGERLQDVLPNADLPKVAYEMMLKADELQLTDKLKQELCEDYARYFNANG